MNDHSSNAPNLNFVSGTADFYQQSLIQNDDMYQERKRIKDDRVKDKSKRKMLREENISHLESW